MINYEKPPLILIIDDDEAVRLSLRYFLEDFGYEVVQARDGQEGLEVVHAQSPDLVLTDLRMPNMDGLEVLAEVTRSVPDIPIVIISGAGDIRDVVEALRLGAWDYLLKPIQDMGIFLHSVQTCLDRARLKQQNKEYHQSLEESLDRLHRTQKELLQSAKMAALGDLVSGVAHEVNTPLGVSVTAASFLLERTRQIREQYHLGDLKRSDLEKYLCAIHDSALVVVQNLDRAAKLIQSFQKIATDQRSEKKQYFDLCPFLEQILISLQSRYGHTAHKIYLECQECLKLYSYPGAVMQIVVNLVSNSLVHGFIDQQPGEIFLTVSLVSDTQVRIVYRDTGVGMAEEQKERLYDPFYTTQRGADRAGLGMHIVYNLITQTLKGTIHLQASPGQGVLFTLMLPVDPDLAASSL
ncbi:MAG: response regulator [Desulfovibrionales bacterium]|nr:response regulator [Desulfovibrionales bacterium]